MEYNCDRLASRCCVFLPILFTSPFTPPALTHVCVYTHGLSSCQHTLNTIFPPPLPSSLSRRAASPVSGLLNVRGVLGGSVSAPTGLIKVKLLDGALGRQRLARSTASLALNTQQQLSVDVELAPADSHGYVKLAGSIDLLGPEQQQHNNSSQDKDKGSSSSSSSGPGAQAVATKDLQAAAGNSSSSTNTSSRGKKKKGRGSASQPAPPAAAAAESPAADHPAAAAASGVSAGSGEPHLELGLSVRDGGMSLLTSLAPGLTWGGGSASLNFAATGPAASPLLTGSASFNKGSLSTSVLRHPLTQLSGSLAVDGYTLAVSGLEAKVGPKGSLAIRGSLPITHNSSSGGSSGSSSGVWGGVDGRERLHAAVSGVELRVRNVYSGSLDADLDLRGSLSGPMLGGRIVFSKGTAFLVPPAASSSGGHEAAAAAAASSSSNSSQAELVRTAFAALKAGRARAATTAAAADTRGTVSRGLSGVRGGVLLRFF